MSEVLIRAQIKAVLSGSSGIGVIHDRRRYSDTWDAWFTLMTSGGKINGWTINREETPAAYDTNATIARRHTFTIMGFMDVDDTGASETTFQAILDSIFTTFAGNRKLNGTAQNSGPINIEYVRVDLFGDELVNRLLHVAQLTLLVEERAFI
jgi:hypothetical protein